MTPEQHYRQVMKNPHLKVDGKVTGEGFCWHAAYSADSFVTAYQAWRDTAWLEQGVVYFDWLLGLMETAPDGYKGWIGPYGYDKSVWCDVHVGDAILFNPMLRLAEIVLADGALRETYGEAANRYVAAARKHLLEKWDARGTWREDGPYGAYVAWDQYMEPGDIGQWKPFPAIKNSTLSLPFNKQFDMGIAALRIYRITGEAPYREKVERIFRTMKARIQSFDDHYVWNYWEPLGAWDIDPETDAMRHWVNVHPYRNYQAGEIHNIVEAYHSGIVFDRRDIEMMLNTNLKVMWNGDRDNPKWRNSNERGEWAPPPPPPKGWEGRAGTLWSGFIDFSQTVRDLYAPRLRPGRISHGYYHNVTAKEAPGFDRKHVRGDISVFDVPFSECDCLIMAAALPSEIQRGTPAILICKSPASGGLEIALYTTDGVLKKVLYTGDETGGPSGHEGVTLYRWDGVDPDGAETYSGGYRIRWTRNGQYREFPVTIQ